MTIRSRSIFEHLNGDGVINKNRTKGYPFLKHPARTIAVLGLSWFLL